MTGDETVTVEVYDGYHDAVPETDPDWSADVGIYRGGYYDGYPRSPPHEADTARLADDIAWYSGAIALWVGADDPVALFVHTNDSYHDPDDWDPPVERGLAFGPDVDTTKPFGCELWGRVVLWVAERERGRR